MAPLALILAATTSGSSAHAEPSPFEPSPFERLDLPAAFHPELGQISEAWASVAGQRRAVVYSGRLAFGATVDLDVAGWVPGASIAVRGLGVQGDNLSSDTIGDASIVSNVAGVNAVRLFQAWYRQRLLDDALEARVGILAIDDDFMVADSALLFVNSGFGTAQTLALNTPAPIYPLGALGAYLRWQPAENLELQLAVYDNDAGDPTGLRYFSDLGLSANQGAIVLAEVGWQVTNWRLSLGGFGVSGVPTREGASRGMGSGYLMLEHTLGYLGDSEVQTFAHAAIAGPTRQVVADAYADAGVTIDGSAWARPDDAAGFGVAWTRFSPSHVRDRGRPTSAGETAVELTYRTSVLPWLSIQPDVQWIRAPKNAPRDDAVALAVRVAVRL